MLFNWLNAKEAEEFGISLAIFFSERIVLNPSTRKIKSTSKKLEVISKMVIMIVKFRTSHKLNFYKKAKVGNAFKWHLLELGYEKEFVDDLTKELVKKL